VVCAPARPERLSRMHDYDQDYYPRPSDYSRPNVALRGGWDCVLAQASALYDLHHGSLAMDVAPQIDVSHPQPPLNQQPHHHACTQRRQSCRLRPQLALSRLGLGAYLSRRRPPGVGNQRTTTAGMRSRASHSRCARGRRLALLAAGSISEGTTVLWMSRRKGPLRRGEII
jgi:hypothetical protein